MSTRRTILECLIADGSIEILDLGKERSRVPILQLVLSDMAALSNNASTNQYSRRYPESRLLYRTVETYWPLFLREQARVGRTLPIFIKEEFEKFLQCGIPEVATRQWVLSFPYKLRYLMAYNPKLTNKILSLFIKVISTYQKQKAKERGIKKAKIGSVAFIQRFGSALQLTVHFHALFADGVFYKTGENSYEFFRLPTPSPEELGFLVAKIHDKVLKLIIMERCVGRECGGLKCSSGLLKSTSQSVLTAAGGLSK